MPQEDIQGFVDRLGVTFGPDGKLVAAKQPNPTDADKAFLKANREAVVTAVQGGADFGIDSMMSSPKPQKRPESEVTEGDGIVDDFLAGMGHYGADLALGAARMPRAGAPLRRVAGIESPEQAAEAQALENADYARRGLMAGAGNLAAEVASPVNKVLPFAGGGLGALAKNAATQAAMEGYVRSGGDPKAAAVSGAVGGVAAPVFATAARGIGAGLQAGANKWTALRNAVRAKFNPSAETIAKADELARIAGDLKASTGADIQVLPGDVNRTIGKLEEATVYAPFSPAMTAHEARMKGLREASGEVARKFDPGGSDPGGDLARSVQETYDRNRGIAQGLYDRVDAVLGDISEPAPAARLSDVSRARSAYQGIDVRNIRNSAADLAKRMRKLLPSNQDSRALAALDDASQMPAQSYGDLHQNRAAWLEKARDAEARGEKQAAAIYGKLASEAENSIEAFAGKLQKTDPKAYEIYRKAQDFWKQNVVPFETGQELSRILKAGEAGGIDPERIIPTKLAPGRTSSQERILSQLGPEGRDAARAGVMRDAVTRATDQAGNLSPVKFARELQIMTRGQAALFSPDERVALEGLAKINRVIGGRSGDVLASPPTGVRLLQSTAGGAGALGLLAGGGYGAMTGRDEQGNPSFDAGRAAKGALTGAALAVGTPYAVGRMLTSPTALRILTQAAKAESPAKVQALGELLTQYMAGPAARETGRAVQKRVAP